MLSTDEDWTFLEVLLCYFCPAIQYVMEHNLWRFCTTIFTTKPNNNTGNLQPNLSFNSKARNGAKSILRSMMMHITLWPAIYHLSPSLTMHTSPCDCDYHCKIPLLKGIREHKPPNKHILKRMPPRLPPLHLFRMSPLWNIFVVVATASIHVHNRYSIGIAKAKHELDFETASATKQLIVVVIIATIASS